MRSRTFPLPPRGHRAPAGRPSTSQRSSSIRVRAGANACRPGLDYGPQDARYASPSPAPCIGHRTVSTREALDAEIGDGPLIAHVRVGGGPASSIPHWRRREVGSKTFCPPGCIRPYSADLPPIISVGRARGVSLASPVPSRRKRQRRDGLASSRSTGSGSSVGRRTVGEDKRTGPSAVSRQPSKENDRLW